MYRAKLGSPKAKPPIRRRFGHTAVSSARMMGPIVIRCPVLVLALILAALSGGVAAAQVTANAADEYARLGVLLAELEADEEGPWRDPTGNPTGDSFDAFAERGQIDARMQRWLDKTRPLIGDLVRTAGLAYDLPLDRSAGFALLLPHLSRQRTIVKSLDVLMIDARRRDPAVFIDLLRAQAAICERTATDGVLVSSLVAMACGEKTRSRLDEMIDRGEIDGELAKQALSATAEIDGKDALRLPDALENEHAALTLEIGKIAGVEGDERAQRVQQLAGLMGAGARADAFTDEAVAAFPAQAGAFRDATRAVLDAPSREAALAAEAELAKRVEAGAFGDLIKALAPALGKVVDRAWRYDADWTAVRDDLTALAEGRKTPEDLMDAGIHYIRAAAAAQQLRPNEQAEFDSLRLAGDALEPDIRAAGKSRLARLQQSITAEVFRGSQLGRLGLDDRTLQMRRVSFNNGLVRATQPGINGAVRTMLAAALTDDAMTKTPLETPVASPQELAVAAVRVAAHYASTAQFGHSLAALTMLRDAADAIDALKAKGGFDADGRALLAKALVKIDATDPVGLGRAKEAERGRLERSFSDLARLARLAPGDIAFLLAAVAEADVELSPIDCDCPLHGAFLDMRGWFNAGALKKATAARVEIEKRLELARSEGLDRIPGPPAVGLELEAAFDIDRAREAAQAAIARLERLAAEP
jgi:hypothetical protein